MTIRLLKKHDRGEVGAVISVPFWLGREMVEKGIGVNANVAPVVTEIQAAPEIAKPAPAAPVVVEKPKAKVEEVKAPEKGKKS